MKFTRIIALVLAMLMCLAFVACTAEEAVETDTESAATDTKAPETDPNETDPDDDDDDDDDDDGESLKVKTYEDGTVIYFNDFQKYSDTTDHSALTALGWDKQTVEEDGAHGEVDAEFDFENGRLHVNTYADSNADGKHGFYAIPELNHEKMESVFLNGYTLQYDIAFTPDISNNNSLCSFITNYASGINWSEFSVRPGGTALYETLSGGTSYEMLSGGGKTISLTNMFGTTLLNKSFTVRVQNDPDVGVAVYMKESNQPDTSFVKIAAASNMTPGYVAWSTALSNAIVLHTCHRFNAYLDNILVYTGTGATPDSVTITPDNFSGSSNVVYGDGTIYYYEDFNDDNTYSDGVMVPATLANDSAAVAQRYGITVTSADDHMTPSFWIDDGRLMISTFTGITGDERVKDTAGGFAFFTLEALKNSQLQSQIYSNKFTIQYDIAYSCRGAGETALAYDTASWSANLITLMNMDGTSGTACGLAAGGYVRLEYFTDKVGAILTEENMFVRGKGLSNKLRESDVGTITVRIQVDPEANTIKLYGKTGTMTQFELLAETSATSAGYAAMSAATSKLIGFGVQYGNNAMLDNLLIYSGHGDAPDTSNYTPAN